MQTAFSDIKRMVLLDIDALNYRALQQVLTSGAAPNLARLLGGDRAENGCLFEAVASAPSVTYTCQASSITGAHPGEHGIVGNQFFDRFGLWSQGKPRKYEFDFSDFPAVFRDGLAGKMLNQQTPTLYESAAKAGWRSTVVYNMYARGADCWLKPGLDDWRQFVSYRKFGFGEQYDRAMIADALQHLRAGNRPEVLMLYFFGLDHESHLRGPGVQAAYLCEVVDPLVGELVEEYRAQNLLEDCLFVIFSDHGQAEIRNDDLHALKVGFLFDREMGYVFESAGLDVHDHPLEGADCDALLSPAGGLAQVYVRAAGGRWADPPRFEKTLRLARAFWDANAQGTACPDLRGSLECILVRNVEKDGWRAGYQVYTPSGMQPMAHLTTEPGFADILDAPQRLRALSSPLSGDLLLFANYPQGYSFTTLPYLGMHGSLHASDSSAVLAFCLPGASGERAAQLGALVQTAIAARCRAEGGRQAGNVDMAFAARSLLGWESST